MERKDSLSRYVSEQLRMLKQTDENRHLTIPQMAAAANVSTPAMERYLSGARVWPIGAFVAVCDIMRADVGEVVNDARIRRGDVVVDGVAVAEPEMEDILETLDPGIARALNEVRDTGPPGDARKRA